MKDEKSKDACHSSSRSNSPKYRAVFIHHVEPCQKCEEGEKEKRKRGEVGEEEEEEEEKKPTISLSKIPQQTADICLAFV